MEQLVLHGGMRCPCCGSEVKAIDPGWLIEFMKVSGLQRALLELLATRFGRNVATQVICETVWSGVRDGGPGDACNNIAVYAYQLRKKLKPYGLTITGNSPSGCYRLEWISGS